MPPELDKLLAGKSEALRRRMAAINALLLEEVMCEEIGEGGVSILDDITQKVEEEVERRLGREMQWTASVRGVYEGERLAMCGESVGGGGFMPCTTIAPLLVTTGS